ncbi:hypothetical protein AB0K53_13405 [Streptomyces tuirus]
MWTRTRRRVVLGGCAHSPRTLHDFADDVSDALRLVMGMAGEGPFPGWVGKSADHYGTLYYVGDFTG